MGQIIKLIQARPNNSENFLFNNPKTSYLNPVNNQCND